MIVKRTICVVLGVLLLAGVAAAIDLSASSISNSNSGWLTVNGIDTTTITVIVAGSSGPVPGAIVTFGLDSTSTATGSFSPGSVTTGADGKATTTFTTAFKSGNAIINGTIQASDGTVLTLQTTQPVDHNIAQYSNYTYLPLVTVGTVTPISIKLTDQYGNPIDSNNPSGAHNVTLYTTASAGGEGFFNGTHYVDSRVLAPDATGRVTVNYRVSMVAGQNTFLMASIGNINDPPRWITGIGNTHPAYIMQSYPVPSSLPADGAPAHYFTIDYIITDVHGNPANTTLLFTGDDGTSSMKVTNPVTGKVRAYFGPKDIIGHYTLTGSTPDNSSVFCIDSGAVGGCNQTVEYYNTSPTDMSLTANPQGMASLDVDPSSIASIQARVMDIKGNPVTGEIVTFTFSNSTPTYPGGPYNETVQPHLSAASASVANGYATIYFTPGAFADYDSPDYNATATGEMVVSATWSNITRNVTLVWKNYPYLSISSEAGCAGKAVGDAINVSIKLSGDGAALKPKPIDAMMVMDNSGSMTMTPKMDGPEGITWKYNYSQAAGRIFVNKMDPAADKVGLVKYNAGAILGYNVSNNFAGVTNAINLSNLKGATNTRDALKLGIDNLIIDSKNPKAIKAVILLTDGAYNQNGDPLAREPLLNRSSGFYDDDGDKEWTYFPDWPVTDPKQNVAYYAKLNGIRIYTVTLGTDAKIQENYVAPWGTWQIYDTMDQIASQTGAQHFHATDGAQLINVYETIAGLLQETAGGETEVSLDFGTVNINDNLLDANITTYMNYTYYHNASLGYYEPTDSTYINRTKLEKDGTITLQSESLQDDTNHWIAHSMLFDVGTVKLNETWSMNFRLNLTKMGKIELFGPDQPASKITFKDAVSNATQTAFIPAIQCNIVDKRAENRGDANLTIYDLEDGMAGPFTTSWPIQYKYTFNGTAVNGMGNIRYMNNDRPSQGWNDVNFGWVTLTANSFEEQDHFTIITSDDTKWPPGERFCVQITGYSDDVNGNPVSNVWCRQKQGTGSGQYIKLE